MVDLSDTQAAANNSAAEDVKADGRIIGIPEKLASDYVYYWADVFEDADVERASYLGGICDRL